MIHVFHGKNAAAHDGFQSWRKAHVDGFNLSKQGQGLYVLHWVQDKRDNLFGRGCHHQGVSGFAYVEGGPCYTAAEKICSDSFEELRSWAQQNGATVKACVHCDSKKFPFPATEFSIDKLATTGNRASMDAEDGWSTAELQAAVDAYIQMQDLERAGKPYTKKSYYSALSGKYGRSEKAFEYRMQNISYVLSLMGLDWIQGLKPAKNVGANVATEIERLLTSGRRFNASPRVGEQVQVRNQLRASLAKPVGVVAPPVTQVAVTQYRRDVAVKAWVLQQAEGRCECCSQAAPFVCTDGMPFLEVHHIRQLRDGGADTVENTVALCPNCHRELHFGANAKTLTAKLETKVRSRSVE